MPHRGAYFELYYQIKTFSIGVENCDLVFFIKVFFVDFIIGFTIK